MVEAATRDFALGAQTKVQPAVCPIAVMYPERSLGSGAAVTVMWSSHSHGHILKDLWDLEV
jgi:hypothetical protein